MGMCLIVISFVFIICETNKNFNLGYHTEAQNKNDSIIHHQRLPFCLKTQVKYESLEVFFISDVLTHKIGITQGSTVED
jgi:hypothetical protein